MTTLSQDLTKLAELKADHQAKDKIAKAAKVEADKWQAKCFSRMEVEDMKSASVGDKRFARTETVMAQVQDRSEFIRWAKENEPDLVVEKEFAAELNALVRQRLDDNEALPPGIGYNTLERVSVTGL